MKLNEWKSASTLCHCTERLMIEALSSTAFVPEFPPCAVKKLLYHLILFN